MGTVLLDLRVRGDANIGVFLLFPPSHICRAVVDPATAVRPDAGAADTNKRARVEGETTPAASPAADAAAPVAAAAPNAEAGDKPSASSAQVLPQLGEACKIRWRDDTEHNASIIQTREKSGAPAEYYVHYIGCE